jgi:hypothetical protein
MRRRDFIKAIGGTLVVWPVVGRAQQPERTRCIGVILGVSNDAEGQARNTARGERIKLLAPPSPHNNTAPASSAPRELQKPA